MQSIQRKQPEMHKKVYETTRIPLSLFIIIFNIHMCDLTRRMYEVCELRTWASNCAVVHV